MINRIPKGTWLVFLLGKLGRKTMNFCSEMTHSTCICGLLINRDFRENTRKKKLNRNGFNRAELKDEWCNLSLAFRDFLP